MVVLLSFFLVGGVLPAGCSSVDIQTRNGVYHTVRRGETLWRICHAYRVNMKSVIRFNGIEDPTRIRVGQRLFIPGAEAVVRVEPPRQAPRVAQRPVPGHGRQAKATARKRAPASSTPPAPGVGGASPAGLRFVWPVKGPVTSWYGVRNGRRHDGIDIAAAEGTPIRAAEKGKVIYSDNGLSGYGNLIIIRHRGGYHSVYAHNRKNRVEVDRVVEKGQVIGEVGDTGRARGHHLHFEIRRGDRSVDPMTYLP